MTIEVSWIKLSLHLFDDEKIRLIEHMPEGDSILLLWIRLLIQAGKCNAGGVICLSETLPYTDEMLATLSGKPIATVRLALSTFEQFGMITRNDVGMIAVTNWAKHQNIDGMERVRELTRARVARHREKQKALMPDVTSRNVTVTQQNKKEKKIENKIENKKEEREPAIAGCAMCRSPKTASGGTDYLMQQAHNLYREKFGECWTQKYPAGAKGFKDLLDSGKSEAAILAVYRKYLTLADDWYAEHGYSLAWFFKQYDGIKLRDKNGQHRSGSRRSGKEEFPEAGGWTDGPQTHEEWMEYLREEDEYKAKLARERAGEA